MDLIIVIASTVFYIAIYLAGDSLFDTFSVDKYHFKVFFPSGAMVFMALVFESCGILGIALGSLLISIFYLSEPSIAISIGNALLIGAGLWMARKLSTCALALENNLRGINIKQIIYIIFIFTSINTLILQIFYYLLNPKNDYFLEFAEKLISNLLGALLVLLLIRISVHSHHFIFKKI
jgi:hypothetical protein